jgi:hypothetical protein
MKSRDPYQYYKRLLNTLGAPAYDFKKGRKDARKPPIPDLNRHHR